MPVHEHPQIASAAHHIIMLLNVELIYNLYDAHLPEKALNAMSFDSTEHAEPATAATKLTSQPTFASKEQPSNARNLLQRPDYRLMYTMGGHTMSISSIKFSPDGSTLASAGVLPIPANWLCYPFTIILKQSFRQTNQALGLLHRRDHTHARRPC